MENKAPIQTVNVNKRQMQAWEYCVRIPIGLLGLASIIGGLLLCLTIIGILPGIGMMLTGGLLVMPAFLVGHPVSCPFCANETKLNIYKHDKAGECSSCKNNFPVKWPK
ncbi:YccF domain-containing protein [Geomicrobium sp. JCM 19037]|uniref:YccF domain-containing protein n=1 Tax=Geomicrobium sp. JCM 19037 TaxID=1460634 RepID=UPI0005A6A6B7|nr:YccF domain-containing protein [Geomicrobium sp. JCM 19037]